MTKIWKNIKENWYWYIVGIFLVSAGLFYLIVGEDSYIAVHDNLDLFTAQYKMLKDGGLFFSHGSTVPFLGGVTRDKLPSEFSLAALLYMVLPMFGAYVAGYLLKIVIAVGSFYLLAGELFGEGNRFWRPLAVLCGFAYGLLNVFPAFGIPFASVPLVIYIVLKIDRASHTRQALLWYVALAAYPFVSYFSYFGLFLCGYLVVAFVWVSIVRKKIDLKLLAAVPVLSIGYVAFEYRLFASMLFSDEITIRSTMAGTEFTLAQVLSETWDVFAHSMFHAESLQYKWVMPLCLIWFVVQNVRYVTAGQARKIVRDLFNLIMLLLLCNALIYGLYDFAPVRNLVKTLCPPLTGWQFNRTLFFNPFLWYAALFVMLYRITAPAPAVQESGTERHGTNETAGETVPGQHGTPKENAPAPSCKRRAIQIAAQTAAVCAAGVAILLILLSDTRYNDLLHTGYNTALKVVKHKEPDVMNYREFYGEKLFEKALADLAYQGEWSAAYGFHPAVLQYNRIATLDGYLGFYAQEYKEAFREIIAPALERVEASRINFDDWGARAYLYAGTDITAVSEYKSFAPTDYDLYIDLEAFHKLGGTYIFSRFPLANAQQLGLEAAGVYEEETIPYKLYVYR